MRRPGRFDREILFPLPGAEARKQILKIHTKKWEQKPTEDFYHTMALKTTGYCGADLKALCTEAVLNTLRRTYPAVYRTQRKIMVKTESLCPGHEDFRQAMQVAVISLMLKE